MIVTILTGLLIFREAANYSGYALLMVLMGTTVCCVGIYILL